LPLNTFQVRVQSINYETDQIRTFTLADRWDRPLPKFTPGAHIDVHLEAGGIRQYSICSSVHDETHYRIAVLRHFSASEFSEYFFNQVQVGDLLKISEPKNLLKLVPGAERYLLIAGGIGISAIMSIVYALEYDKVDYELHYCTRNEQSTPFRQELTERVRHGRLEFHMGGGNSTERLDIPLTLKEAVSGTHLYYCGPASLMEAAREASSHWPSGTVHCEHFYPESLEKKPIDTSVADSEFQVRLASTGRVFRVPSHKSIIDVLMENGIVVDKSCEEGYCGTCLTRYLEGEPEHRDEILDADDQQDYVLICCARSKSAELVLDL